MGVSLYEKNFVIPSGDKQFDKLDLLIFWFTNGPGNYTYTVTNHFLP